MVKLVIGRENKIPIKITSTIDHTGFAATVAVAGIEKSVPDLKAASLSAVFSPSDVEAVGDGEVGYLTVFNKDGDVHVKQRICFYGVESEADAADAQKISVVLVSQIKYEGGKPTPDPEIDKKVQEAVDKAMAEAMGEIDQHIEDTVNEMFDSSDSDTPGGMLNGLEHKVNDDIEPRVETLEVTVEDNIQPRLTQIETTLEKKISMDYDDSDEGVVFKDGYPISEDSSDIG